MAKFYLGYDSTSLAGAVDLMGEDYFVTAHSFRKQKESQEVVLDFKLFVQGQTTDALDYKIAFIKEMVQSAAFSGPPNNVGPELMLWGHLGTSQLWSIWTVKRGNTAPIDAEIADGSGYYLHIQLYVVPQTIGDRLLVSNLTVNGSQTVYVASVPGTKPGATKFTLSNMPTTLAKLWAAGRGHKALHHGDFDPHYPAAGSAVLDRKWQTLASIVGHGQPFDTGVFDFIVDVAGSAPIIEPVRDLAASTGNGALPGGFYNYAQSTIVNGAEGPASNTVSVNLGGSTAILFGVPTPDLIEAVGFGGRLRSRLAYGIDANAMPLVGDDAYSFNLESDGLVMQELITQTLKLEAWPKQGYNPPTNKLLPTDGVLGYTSSLVRILLPLCQRKQRSVTMTLDIDRLQLGSLGSPAFFPLFAEYGVMFDLFGWRLYAATTANPIDEWQSSTLKTANLLQPLSSHNTVALEVDWRVGFTKVALKVNGQPSAVLFLSAEPQRADVLVGSYLSCSLPEPTFVRIDDPNPANWSFTKVQLSSKNDTTSSSASSSQSDQGEFGGGESHSDSNDRSFSFTGGGGASNSDNQSFSDSDSASSNSGNASGHSTGFTSQSHTSTLQFHYKKIPISRDGGDVLTSTPLDEQFIGTAGFLTPGGGVTITLAAGGAGTVLSTKDIPTGSQLLNAFVFTPISYGKMSGEHSVNFVDYDTPLFTSSASLGASPSGGGSNSSSGDSGNSHSSGGGGGGGVGDSGSSNTDFNNSHTHTDSSQTSSSNSFSASTEDSTSKSHSESTNGSVFFDIPLESKTRKVTYVGGMDETSTSTSFSTTHSDSSQTGTSKSRSDSEAHALSAGQSSNGSGSHESSSTGNSEGSLSKNDSFSSQEHDSAGITSSKARETSIPGDISDFEEATVPVGDPIVTDIQINKPAPGRDVKPTTAIVDRGPGQGIEDQLAVVLGVPRIDSEEVQPSGPLFEGIHNVFTTLHPEQGQAFVGEIPVAGDPEVSGPISTSQGALLLGGPSQHVGPPEGPTTTDATQEAMATTGGNSSSGSHQHSDANSSGGGHGDSHSSSASGSSGNNNGDSRSTSNSDSSSTSQSSSSSDSGQTSKTKSVTLFDVYQVQDRPATTTPEFPFVGTAALAFRVSGVRAYDGGLPTSGSDVSLAWTPDAHGQAQRVYRRSLAVIGSRWQYKTIDAGIGGFVDNGEPGWADGDPPTTSFAGGPSCVRLVLDGIINTRAVRLTRGYGGREYLVFPGTALPPSPTEDSPHWTADIQGLGAGVLIVNDCFVLPQDQTQGTVVGASATWEFETTRHRQSSSQFTLDTDGDFRLSPGGNVLALVGQDSEGRPLSMEGTKVDIAITPETDWMQALA